MDTLQKMRKARAALITGNPFFGSLALRLVLEESRAIKTMDTNGVTLRYNPAFVDKLSNPELAGVVAHEVMHCALEHIGRLKGRDLKQWNIATDYAINPLLRDAGLTLPTGALFDARFTGVSADEIYGLLPAPAPQPQPQAGGGTGQGDAGQSAPGEPENAPDADPGECGGIRPAPQNETQADAQQIAQEWKIATAQAVKAAEAAGKMPGALLRAVAEAMEPKIDWREILRAFITSAVPTEYMWTPPNRRYVSQGIYLPALRPDHIGRVAVFIDTSGSIDAETLAAFSAELNAILEDCGPDYCNVVYADTRVNSAAEYERDAYPVELKAQGGGGTDFRPPFDYLDREGIEPDACVYLTDLHCHSFPAEPAYPVLWVSTGATHAPFGEVIRLEAGR